MPKTPKTPRLSTGKATKPELKPLDPFLAELLNPALNREREREERRPANAARTTGSNGDERPDGFAEAPQAAFAHGTAADVDPALAKKLGLRGAPTTARTGARTPPTTPPSPPRACPAPSRR